MQPQIVVVEVVVEITLVHQIQHNQVQEDQA
jgi:hypothetical protein